MLNIFTEHTTDIIHKTSVDFVLRPAGKVVNLIQYDDTLPILKVSLFNNNKEYILPDDTQVYLRYLKPDGTFCYNGALGISEDKTAVYFIITFQMTTAVGKATAVVEFVKDDNRLASSPIQFNITMNPVQSDAIESNVEIGMVQEILNEATAAVTAAQQAAQVAVDAKNYILNIIGGGYVTLATDQSITGTKDFVDINVNGTLTFNQNGVISGDIIPETNANSNIGNNIKRMNDIYGVRLIGNKLVLGNTELDETKLRKLLDLLEVMIVEEDS